MQRYDSYKDSGVKWLGEIPSHWEVLPGLAVFQENKEKNNNLAVNTVLSLSYGKIVVKKDIDEGLVPAEYNTYQIVHPGYIIIRCTDLQNDKVSLRTGLVKDDGIITGAYLGLVTSGKYNSSYMHYFLHAWDITKEIYRHGNGLRQSLSWLDLRRLPILIPPMAEQTAIANYLDTATEKIDAAIAQQQKMIDLLNERKQIIINRAVTKGLNPNAKMKDSGVEWIGEVPCHWECRKLKSICANTQYSIKTGPFGSQLKGDDIQEFGDVPIYNQRVVIDNDCYLFNSYVSKAKADALKSFVVKSKDLLITTRGTIGKSTIVPNDAFEGILHPCIIAIRLNFDLCWNEYMQYFFQSIAFNTDMTLKSNATTIEVIYSYNLKECFVPLPPIDEQKQIVEYLNEELVRINQTIDATINQISLLQDRKQIIINEVVTGKVKVILV